MVPRGGATADDNVLDHRNPEDTLNFQELLKVCGTATNAFVNLAQSSGLPARRLLLLNEERVSKHVVVEVLIDNRWIIVDPSYRTMLRLPDGSLVTRAELQNPEIFHAATQAIPDYPQDYTYERTVHVRIGRIPWIGRYLRTNFHLHLAILGGIDQLDFAGRARIVCHAGSFLSFAVLCAGGAIISGLV